MWKRFFTNEWIVFLVIFVNSFALFVHEFYDPNPVWFWIDYSCLIFFSIESCFKIHHYRRSGEWMSGWDPIDIAIVILCIPVLLTPFLDLPEYSAILVFRLGRLFRLFRLMRFIPDSKGLISGVLRALKASVGVFLALSLFNTILGLAAAFLFKEEAPALFGTPLRAFYTMFRVFTIEGWYEIPEVLLRVEAFKVPFWQVFIRVFFAASVLLGGVLGLSLANAIFVDEMVMDNNVGLERRLDEMRDEIRQLRESLVVFHRDGMLAANGGEPGDPG